MKSKVILAALICLIYTPAFIWLVNNWLSNPYYRHGFLVPVISGFIFWIRRDSLKRANPSSAGLLIFILALALYAACLILWIFPLAALSLPIALFGLIAYLCGIKRAMSFVFPILFLLFMIPLPWLDTVNCQLQNITTNFSAAMAQLLGTATEVTGNQIALTSATFTVGEPCSGMSTLISLLTLAAIVAFLANGSSPKRIVIFLSAFPIAILANAFRVTSLLVIADLWSTDASLRFFHGPSSALVFIVALALIILIARLLGCRLRTWRELVHE